MASKQIVIATNSGDHPNCHVVVAQLLDRGYEPIVIEADSIANGSASFSMGLTSSGEPQVTYKGQNLDVRRIGAAWFRRPHYYGNIKNRLRWEMIREEYEAVHDSFCDLIPEDAWLNSPGRMRTADVKMPQLLTAASLGFEIPDSTITNDWEIVETLPSKEVIIKFITRSTVPLDNGGYKALPTTILSRRKLPKHGTPYPGLWQTFIPKKREWRITVVGDKVFCAAIYTGANAKNDWRQHQFDEKRVTFKAEELPRKYQKLCIAYTKHYGLHYGAFDLVERPDGSIVFLEINAAGQFMWIEEKLGLPISAAIVDCLIGIAEQRAETVKN